MHEVAKSQWVRAYDAIVMSPMLIRMAKRYKMRGLDRAFMVHAQYATMGYNTYNAIVNLGKPVEPYAGVPLGMSTVYESTERQVAGSQVLRLVDIFGYGPMCLYIAAKQKMRPIDRGFLIYTGISTIILNWLNYRANKTVNGKA